MATPLDNVTCARLPATDLAALAGFRRLPGLVVRLDGEHAWLWWSAGGEGVLHCLLPLTGVELYEQRDGLWYRPGHHLPSFEVPPTAGGQPLDNVLFPEPAEPEPPPELSLLPAVLRLQRDGRSRPATGLECGLAELARWAETATSARLAGLQAARAGGRALVLGRQPPALSGAVRFWGERVLVPLGFRPVPTLPEGDLLAALGAGAGDLLVLGPEGAEVVPAESLRPLSRAAVRLAAREVG